MKHIFFAAASLVLLAACDKPNDFLAAPAVPQTKTINLSFGQSKDYSAAIFDGVEAELRIAVTKFETVDGGGSTVVWDTLVPFQSLRLYPEATAPWQKALQVNVSNDFREHVSASYAIRYRDAQNRVSTTAANDFALPGKSTLLLDVKL
jgi:hypothetical protein